MLSPEELRVMRGIKMKDTEYTLNALSYGWWQDKVYQFNDPDHIVLRDATDGENRASVLLRVSLLEFSLLEMISAKAVLIGEEKAMKYLTNAEINAIANGESFHPGARNGEKSENQFVRMDKDGKAYYAVFNYMDLVVEDDYSFRASGVGFVKGI